MYLQIIQVKFILSIFLVFVFFSFAYLMRLSEEFEEGNQPRNVERSMLCEVIKQLQSRNAESQIDENNNEQDHGTMGVINFSFIKKIVKIKFKKIMLKIVKCIEFLEYLTDMLFDKVLNIENVYVMYPFELAALNSRLNSVLDIINVRVVEATMFKLLFIILLHEIFASQVTRSIALCIKFPQFSHMIIRRAEIGACCLQFIGSYVLDAFAAASLKNLTLETYFLVGFAVLYQIGSTGSFMLINSVPNSKRLLFLDLLIIMMRGSLFFLSYFVWATESN